MNKNVLAGMLVALPGAIMAQTAIDAYSISQNDLRGSARFMSMGGAFTALGGDISTLNQNPGGIGVSSQQRPFSDSRYNHAVVEISCRRVFEYRKPY